MEAAFCHGEALVRRVTASEKPVNSQLWYCVSMQLYSIQFLVPWTLFSLVAAPACASSVGISSLRTNLVKFSRINPYLRVRVPYRGMMDSVPDVSVTQSILSQQSEFLLP